MTRRLLVTALALTIGVVAAAVLAHAPFVRAFVLGQARAAIEERYGIRVEASRLDYNVLARSAGLADVRVSALTPLADPFLEASYLSVTFPWRSLMGDVVIDDVTASSVHVRVVRRADGTTNLPQSSRNNGGEPAPVRVGRIRLSQLTVDVEDESADFALQIPEATVELAGADGRIALERPASLRAGGRAFEVAQLEGGATFDGRTLGLTGMTLRTSEASAMIEGTLELVASEPALNLRLTGTADAARIADVGAGENAGVEGELAFDALVTGPMTDPLASVGITSARLTWRRLTAEAINARAAVRSEGVKVEHLQFDLQGGRVGMSGTIPFDGEAVTSAIVSWTGVRVAPVAAAFSAGPVLPAAEMSGTVELEGAWSRAHAWLVDLRLRAEPLDNGQGRLAFGGDGRLFVRDGRWQYSGNHLVGDVAPVAVTVGGALRSPMRLEQLPLVGTLTLGRTDVPALIDVLRLTGLASTAGGTVTAGAIEGAMEVTGRLVEPEVAFALRGVDRLVVSGQSFDEPGVRGRISGSILDVENLAARQPGTAGQLMASGTFDVATRAFTLRDAMVTGWQLVRSDDLPASGVIDGRFAGRGSVPEPHIDGQLTIRAAGWEERQIGDIDARVRLDGARAVIDAELASLDLERVLQGSEVPVPVRGAARVSAHAEGTIDAWRSASATVEVASLEATVGELPLRLLEPARLHYAGDRVTVDRAEAAAGDMRISASGEIPVFEANRADDTGLLVVLSGSLDEVAHAVAATGLTEVPITGGEGPLALFARISGSLEDPVFHGDLEVGPGSVTLEGLPPVADLRVRAHAEGGRVEVRELTAVYQGARLAATGEGTIAAIARDTGRTANETLRLHVRATNVTPDVLAPFLDADVLEQATGSLDATLDVTSATLSLSDLTGSLTIDRFDFRVAELPVTQRIPTRIVARDGTALIEAWEWIGQGATMTVGGQVRLGDQEVALLVGGSIDLRMLTPFVREAGVATAGRLEPRLFVRGPIGNPGFDGAVTLIDAEVRLADPRVLLSGLSARAELEGTTARITGLTGTMNEGPLTGSGVVQYGAGGRLAIELSTEARTVPFEFPPGLRSELDSSLSLVLDTGRGPDVAPSGRISGTVTVRRGAYREPLAVVTGLLTTLRARRLDAAAEPSPLLDALTLDVRVLTDEDLIVDNNYGRFQLGADLRIIGTAAAPALSGRADLAEGGQLFIGRNVYRIDFGTIDFANPLTIEPSLNIRATTRAGGEEIEVTITGTRENLQVALDSPSRPELGQAELASLLLTGRPFEDLAPGDASFVTSQVLGNFSGEMLGFAGRAVGLDTVRLGGVDTGTVRRDPGSVAADLDPTTRLTFGKNIARNVTLTYSQSLRDSSDQTWIVDYLPLRRLGLSFLSEGDDRQTFRFRHEVEFGRPEILARPVPENASSATLTVSAILFTGQLGMPEELLSDRLELRPLDRFDFAEWQDDRERLEALYRDEGFLTARVSATRVDAVTGTTLTYTVMAGPMANIQVSGIAVSSSLRGRLETAWTQSVFDEFLIEEASAIVRDELAGQGYLRSVVEARVDGDANVRTLTIAVEPGLRTSATRIALEGTDGALMQEIETFIDAQGLSDRATLDPGSVENAIAGFLRTNGYLQAKVAAEEPVFRDASAVLPVVIDAGPLVRVASVSFAGVRGLEFETVREATAIDDGSPFDAAEADSARDRMVTLYRREGFTSPVVTVRADVRVDSALVDLVFTVEEGPRQIVQEVVVAGNGRIDSDVVVRALDMEPGAPLRTEDLLRARTRVFETGLFRRVDVSAVPASELAGGPDTIPTRLQVTVEEWAALRLRYGFEIAQEQPALDVEARRVSPGFSADITRRTFFGRALATGGAVEFQPDERLGRVFLSAPTFFGAPVQSSLVLERSRETFAADTLVTDRSSVSWEQRMRVAQSLSLSYSYRFERDHTFNTQTSLDPNDIPFDLTLNVGRVIGSAAWDTRDDASDATRGLLASFSLESAPESAGSDIRFVRQLSQAYYFRPIRDVVLASAARFGVVGALAGQDVIPSERFFAGGARTVRGVAEDSLGGLDFLGFPIGGQALLILNQEVRFPLFRWLRGVGFVDVGNVFPRADSMRAGDLVGSVGAGLRLATPFSLLRVDYGRPVWNRPADASGRWTFGIGQAF